MKAKQKTVLLVAVVGVLLGRDAQAFYNPSTGRWLSRDPIGETGFLAEFAPVLVDAQVDLAGPASRLYSQLDFVRNDPLNDMDVLGLADFSRPKFRVRITSHHNYSEVFIDFKSEWDSMMTCPACNRPKLAQIVMDIEKQFGRRIIHPAVWKLDTDRGSHPWYPYQSFGVVRGYVNMTDDPGTRWWNPTTWFWGVIQMFETCAVCTDTNNKRILGCVNWGHDVGGIGAASNWGAGEDINPVAPSAEFLRLFPAKFD